MDLHVFPIPIPPPTSLFTRSLWVFPVHQARALVSCIQPGLVICFTLDNIHVSMLFSRNIPPSLSPRVQKSVIYFYFRKQLDYLQTINYAFGVAAKILVQFFYFQLDRQDIFSRESAKNLSTVYIHSIQSPCSSCLFPEVWVHPKFLFTTVLLSNRYCCSKLCSLILPLESQTLNCQLQLSSSLKAIEIRISPFTVPLYHALIFLQMLSAFFPLFSNWARVSCLEFFFSFFLSRIQHFYLQVDLSNKNLFSHTKSRFQKPGFLFLNFLNYPNVFQSSSFYCKIILNRVQIYFLNL